MSCEAIPLAVFLFDQGLDLDRLCREETCLRDDLHFRIKSCLKPPKLGPTKRFLTRSLRHIDKPWSAPCQDALRESVYSAVSFSEPRNFQTILHHVENDYGSCCVRSVYRQLCKLRWSGEIVRLDFRGRVHAYLRAGSRLISDPETVYEQVMNLQMGETC